MKKMNGFTQTTPIYTITSIRSCPLICGTQHRIFGYYKSAVKAMEEVGRNTCDMHEGFYNYIVIEGVHQGIHPIINEEIWFRWTESFGRWMRCCKPKELEGTVNFGIG